MAKATITPKKSEKQTQVAVEVLRAESQAEVPEGIATNREAYAATRRTDAACFFSLYVLICAHRDYETEGWEVSKGRSFLCWLASVTSEPPSKPNSPRNCF